MQELFELIESVAASEANILIQGENGTGKELIANAIHYNSKRSKGPFIKINCAAIPKDLIESELFGYKKGAFTGATTDKEGLFEMAEGGSLLLDEIGEMPPYLQTKLLRVLQEREYRPIGSDRIVHVDFRLICATNIDLDTALREGKLREDLYFRINTITLRVPPLRERTEDIPLLCDYFLEKFRAALPEEREDDRAGGLSPADPQPLARQRPRARERDRARRARRQGQRDRRRRSAGIHPRGEQPGAEFVIPPHRTLAEIEKMAILQTLQRTNWNKQEAAQILGLYRPDALQQDEEARDPGRGKAAQRASRRRDRPACREARVELSGSAVPGTRLSARRRPHDDWRVERVGLDGATSSSRGSGDMRLFGGRALRDALRPPFEVGEIARHIYEFGWRSVPLIATSGLAIGVVLSMHTRASLERFGAEAMIPAGLAIALMRETGPLTAGLLVSGRVGAGIGAELGAMRVTEQIDALEATAVDSFKYLAVTRMLACIIALPLLTIVMDFAGIVGGFLAEACGHRTCSFAALLRPRLLAGRLPGLRPGDAEDGGLRLPHRHRRVAISGSRPRGGPKEWAGRRRAASSVVDPDHRHQRRAGAADLLPLSRWWRRDRRQARRPSASST